MNSTSQNLKLLPIIAALIGCLIGLAWLGTISAQSPRPTEEEVVTHEVILADEITIEIDTVINADIKEARLWTLPVGRKTIPSYSYVEFTQNDRIQATGVIDVRSPSYFPPGTIFDVRFEFVAEDDTVYSSDTYRVEHIDSTHNWKRIADDQLEIIFYGINESSIENLHAKTTSRLPQIADALGVSDVPQFRAVIFPSIRELTIHGPTISGAATTGHYFAGYAYDEYNLTIMASPSSETLLHELTHLIFGRALDSPYATSAPAWLNEGNASFWETGSRAASLRDFRPIARSSRVTEFSAMNAIPGLRNDINNFYIQSTDFVGYLIENYGAKSVGNLLAELNRGTSIDDAMHSVYGASLTDLENAWRTEWGLPTVLSFVEQQVDIEQDLPPTIPGLPTIATGTLEQHSSSASPEPETDEAASRANEVTEADMISTAQTSSDTTVATAQSEASPIPQSTETSATPVPTLTPIPARGTYFVGETEEGWPEVRPSAIIVFLLLAAGLAAMMYRRLHT